MREKLAKGVVNICIPTDNCNVEQVVYLFFNVEKAFKLQVTYDPLSEEHHSSLEEVTDFTSTLGLVPIISLQNGILVKDTVSTNDEDYEIVVLGDLETDIPHLAMVSGYYHKDLHIGVDKLKTSCNPYI